MRKDNESVSEIPELRCLAEGRVHSETNAARHSPQDAESQRANQLEAIGILAGGHGGLISANNSSDSGAIFNIWLPVADGTIL